VSNNLSNVDNFLYFSRRTNSGILCSACKPHVFQLSSHVFVLSRIYSHPNLAGTTLPCNTCLSHGFQQPFANLLYDYIKQNISNKYKIKSKRPKKNEWFKKNPTYSEYLFVTWVPTAFRQFTANLSLSEPTS
jgi:hypothetical protein